MPNLFYAGQTDYIEKLNTLATTESVTDGSLAASFLSLVVAGLSTFGGGMQVNAQGSAPTTPASGFTIFADASDIPGWKGENGFVVKLNGTANTADRTYTLPDASGTFALLGSAQTFTAAQTVSINSASAALTLTQAGAGAALSTNGQIVSTLGSGTAPFSVVSATVVANLNAALLNGATFAAPGTIGGGTPGAATFTTLTATGDSTLTGSVGVGSAAFASTKLLLGGTAPAASTLSFGLYNGLTLDPAVTTSAYLNYTVPAIATGGTVATLAHYFVAQGTFTGSATNQYGFAVGSAMTGAANNYGFHSAIASASGRYNFYAAGTAPNVFVGQTSLGGAEGSEGLRATVTASAVNRVQAAGGTTGNPAAVSVQGTDANASLGVYGKGTGVIFHVVRGGISMYFDNPASAVNFANVSGSSTGLSVVYGAGGSDANVPVVIASKGTSAVGIYTASGTIPCFFALNTASAVNWLQVAPATTGTAVTISTGGSDGNRSITLTAAGTGTINVTNPLGLQRYTVATLPAATTDRLIIVSDESGGLVPAFSDGTNWRRVTDRAIVS